MSDLHNYRPLRRTDDAVVSLDFPQSDELLVTRIGQPAALRLHGLSRRTWLLSDGTRTLTEIAGAPDAEPLVRATLFRLHRAGLMEGPEPPEALRCNRREIAVALASLITMGVVGSPAEAASLQASGAACGDGTQCQSGFCVGGKCWP